MSCALTPGTVAVIAATTTNPASVINRHFITNLNPLIAVNTTIQYGLAD